MQTIHKAAQPIHFSALHPVLAKDRDLQRRQSATEKKFGVHHVVVISAQAVQKAGCTAVPTDHMRLSQQQCCQEGVTMPHAALTAGFLTCGGT
jgi:hypothetical protein